MTPKELEGLADLIKEKFEWEDGPRPFQMRAIEAQLRGRDVLVHAGTGAGKTGIIAGPFCHPSSKGRVSIVVSPLLGLQDEQVSP